MKHHVRAVFSLLFSAFLGITNDAAATELEDQASQIVEDYEGSINRAWIQTAFDLGPGGSEGALSGNPHWQLLVHLASLNLATQRIWQDDFNRALRFDYEQRDAACQNATGLCIALSDSRMNDGWHAEWTILRPDGSLAPRTIDRSDNRFSQFSLGRISTVRVIRTEMSTDSACDVWIHARIWHQPQSSIGDSIEAVTGRDGIDQRRCFRFSEDGLVLRFLDTILD